MKKEINIDDILVGGQLARDLYDNRGQLLLRQGTTITADFILSLKRKGIKVVYIDVPQEHAPEKSEIEQLKQRQNLLQNFARHHQVLRQEIKRTYMRGKYQKIMQRELFESMVDLLRMLQQFPDHELIPLYFQARSYTREKIYSYNSHATNVGILCAVLARLLGLDQDLTAEVTLTGFLHDIGKSRLPVQVLEKPGKLNNEELKMVQTHPILGASILTRTPWIKPRIILGVLRHHERLDGSGYPYGAMGSEIPIHARITAVAGVFDTMTSTRTYASAHDVFSAIAHLKVQSFGQLDSRITRILYNRVLQGYEGKQVELLNGEVGTIRCQMRDDEIMTMVHTDTAQYDMNKTASPVIKAILK